MKCDVLIIGTGLGGLLTGAALATAGRQVMLVEQLRFPGGRFTARDIDGYRVPTGAFHMAPYGNNGPLHALLRAWRVPTQIVPSATLGNFWTEGKIYPIKRLLDFGSLFRFSEKLNFGKILFRGKIQREAHTACCMSEWLTNQACLPRVRDFFGAFGQFALGLRLDDLAYNAFRPILSAVVHGGHPGHILGGCGALTADLVQRIMDGGGMLRLNTKAVSLHCAGDRVTGAVVKERQSGREERIACDQVVYNGNPYTVADLLPQEVGGPLAIVPGRVPAYGIAVHYGCQEPMTESPGIVFTLGTRRMAGFVQQTLVDPRLAPAGKHLLSACWVPQTTDLRGEMALAHQDLSDIFGSRFDRCCRKLTSGYYQGTWPVNHTMQGQELSPVSAVAGLHFVGDAFKTPGYPMAEGVACSVKRCLQEMDVLPEE